MLDSISEIFVKNLDSLLKSRGWKDADLAKEIGRSRSGTYKIIKGIAWPSPDAIDRIAKAFSIDVYELFVDHENPKEMTAKKAAEVLTKFVSHKHRQ